jgi:hypothetical protein
MESCGSPRKRPLEALALDPRDVATSRPAAKRQRLVQRPASRQSLDSDAPPPALGPAAAAASAGGAAAPAWRQGAAGLPLRSSRGWSVEGGRLRLCLRPCLCPYLPADPAGALAGACSWCWGAPAERRTRPAGRGSGPATEPGPPSAPLLPQARRWARP